MRWPMTIDDLVGRPFLRGGRGHDGVDCLGLTVLALRLLFPDADVPDPWEDYEAAWKAGDLRARPGIFPEGWTAAAAPIVGDVLVVEDTYGTAGHLAPVVDTLHALHTSQQLGRSARIRTARLMRRTLWVMRPPFSQVVA